MSWRSAVNLDCLKSIRSELRMSDDCARVRTSWPNAIMELLSVGPSRIRSVVGSSATLSAPGVSMMQNRENKCSSTGTLEPCCTRDTTWCSSTAKIETARSLMGPNSVRNDVLDACPTRKWWYSSSSVSTHFRVRFRIPRPSLIPISSTSSSIFSGLRRSLIFSSTSSMYCRESLCRHPLLFLLPRCASASFSRIASYMPAITDGITPSFAAGPDPSTVKVFPALSLPNARTVQLTPSINPGNPVSSRRISGTRDRS
mmetsp:Transcript_47037/g.112051  ORF Transcript_47037/g.112051 Transcript_47037/m.112051 type:complete len:257 (+) Transcript_47037:604-1374(+)